MQQVLIVIGVCSSILILGLLVWLISSSFAARRDLAGQVSALNSLQQQLEALRTAQEKTSDGLQRSLQSGQESLFGSLKSSQEVLGRLNHQIGRLQGTSHQMLELGTEIRKLQQILASPKLRGQLGEWSLETLLTNILPKDSFTLQHTFRDGKIVDVLIQLRDFSVPVDAKFPLPSFVRIQEEPQEAERTRHRRQFQKEVTLHVDKIASSYIRPAEGTLDFALMYVPAENVYYETVVQQSGDTLNLLQYCLDRKVIPVSPTLLYTYLQTCAMGLHGLQIEQQAAEIRQNLKTLGSDLEGFQSAWDTLGSHLRNAGGKYEEAQKMLDRFVLHLEQIQAADA